MKKGHEPAFPTDLLVDATKNYHGQTINPGMSKRFYAACAAMQGIMSNLEMLKEYNFKFKKDHIEHIINDCYKMADELLKQENL
jgi:hypothetical protein